MCLGLQTYSFSSISSNLIKLGLAAFLLLLPVLPFRLLRSKGELSVCQLLLLPAGDDLLLLLRECDDESFRLLVHCIERGSVETWNVWNVEAGGSSRVRS